MEPDKNIASEAEKSTYKLKSDIDTPSEELTELRKANKRKNMLLTLAALFIIALGIILWYVLAHQSD
jgi:membrane protein insertase Oxa1/YidC/SpoIIIJ